MYRLIVVLFILLGGCTRAPYIGLLPQHAISPDDEEIAFSYQTPNAVRLCVLNVKTNQIQILSEPKGKRHLVHDYSPDGKSILLTCGNKGDFTKNRLCIYDKTKKEIYQFGNNQGYITEATYSPDGKQIYFLYSGHFGNFSPIARPGHHRIDLYVVDKDGNNPRQITKYAAYNMKNLNISSDEKYALVHTTWVEESKSEPWDRTSIVDLKTGRLVRKNIFKNAHIIAAKAKKVERIWDTSLSQDDVWISYSIAFNYDLHLVDINNPNKHNLVNIDLSKETVKPISKGPIRRVRFFNKKSRVIFSRGRDDRKLIAVDNNGKNETLLLDTISSCGISETESEINKTSTGQQLK